MATAPFSCTPPYYLAEGVTVDDLDPSQPVYVVFVGRRPGIHQNLGSATQSITGYSGAAWKGGSLSAMQEAWKQYCFQHHAQCRTPGGSPVATPSCCSPSSSAPSPHASRAFCAPTRPAFTSTSPGPSKSTDRGSGPSASSSFVKVKFENDVSNLADHLTRSARFADIRRQYYFANGHVFHTRLSAEVRIADLFPDPFNRPEIASGPWTTSVLIEALSLSTSSQYRFDALIWDSAKTFITTATEYTISGIEDVLGGLSLECLSDVTATVMPTE